MALNARLQMSFEINDEDSPGSDAEERGTEVFRSESRVFLERLKAAFEDADLEVGEMEVHAN